MLFKNRITLLVFVSLFASVSFWIYFRQLYKISGSHVRFMMIGLVEKSKHQISANIHPWLKSNLRECNGSETQAVNFQYLDVKLVCKETSELCNAWHWDVANWTLIYTSTNMFLNGWTGRRICPEPIHGERTAKLVHADGKTDFPGCTNDKHPCAPWSLLAAHYDKKLEQRINTNPCCRKQTIEVTQHMARVFDKHNITYILVGGAVIGLVRDGGAYVPYDTDTDVGVDADDYDKLLKAFPELVETGYVFKWVPKHDLDGRHWYMVGCANKDCLTGPGIALYSVQGDNITARAPPWTYPINITVPPIRRMFEGMKMSFPKEPSKYLDFVYGEGKWTTPLDCTKHYYSQCKA